jgi:hypothetical protein
MKKCYIEASQEWIKKQLNLPKEAVITGIVYNCIRDTYKFYISNYGNLTPEGAVVERREIHYQIADEAGNK